MTKLEDFAGSIKEKFLDRENDYILLVFGAEGEGKSNFAFNIAELVDSNFGIENIVFTRDQFNRTTDKLDKKSVILADEGANIVSKAETQSKKTKRTVKKITMMRMYQLFQIYCLSSPNMLHNYFVRHRLQERGISVAHIPKRGRYEWYWKGSGAIKKMRKDLLSPHKDFAWDDLETSPIKSSFKNYEEYNPDFSRKYLDKKRETIERLGGKEPARELTVKDVVKFIYYRNGKHTTQRQIADVLGTTQQYVSEAKPPMSST